MADTQTYVQGQLQTISNGAVQISEPYSQAVLYEASAAADANLHMSVSGKASTSTPQFFTIPQGKRLILNECVCAAATGVVRLHKDGQPTPYIIVSSMRQAANVRAPFEMVLNPGEYRWVVDDALPA